MTFNNENTMILNHTLGIQTSETESPVLSRIAVRAVIFENDKLFMIQTNQGDYKFPGGGVKDNENHIHALYRETTEETGHSIKGIVKKLGVIIERNPDRDDENTIFEIKSYYYLCTLSDNFTSNNLDDYEAQLGFQPVWITIDQAIQANERFLDDTTREKKGWEKRETFVLKILREELKNMHP